MRKAAFVFGVFLSFFLATAAHAQPALDIKSNPQVQQQRVEAVSPPPSQTTIRTQTPTINQNQVNQSQVTISPIWPSEDIQNLQNQVKTIEAQLGKYKENTKVNSWLGWWWQIGFWVGILWLFPWVFVGWQWTHFKFWGFGWPWPWWFWIPLFWFIPWLWVGWQWWLVWWPWWMWVWWIFPWVFWGFWWIILFKEAMIGIWHRRKSSLTTEWSASWRRLHTFSFLVRVSKAFLRYTDVRTILLPSVQGLGTGFVESVMGFGLGAYQRGSLRYLQMIHTFQSPVFP